MSYCPYLFSQPWAKNHNLLISGVIKHFNADIIVVGGSEKTAPVIECEHWIANGQASDWLIRTLWLSDWSMSVSTSVNTGSVYFQVTLQWWDLLPILIPPLKISVSCLFFVILYCFFFVQSNNNNNAVMINLVINDKDCKLFGEIFLFLSSHNCKVFLVSHYYCGITRHKTDQFDVF